MFIFDLMGNRNSKNDSTSDSKREADKLSSFLHRNLYKNAKNKSNVNLDYKYIYIKLKYNCMAVEKINETLIKYANLLEYKKNGWCVGIYRINNIYKPTSLSRLIKYTNQEKIKAYKIKLTNKPKQENIYFIKFIYVKDLLFNKPYNNLLSKIGIESLDKISGVIYNSFDNIIREDICQICGEESEIVYYPCRHCNICTNCYNKYIETILNNNIFGSFKNERLKCIYCKNISSTVLKYKFISNKLPNMVSNQLPNMVSD